MPAAASQPSVLIVPGLQNSGPAHWQSVWEREHPQYRRVQQRDWDRPDCIEWVDTLDRYVHESRVPVVLVAHSLGCACVAQWVRSKPTSQGKVRGALLVSPVDVDSPAHTPSETRSFSPLPLIPFPFSSIVVASTDDPYVSLKRAQHCASAWGSRFVNIGAAGHINAQSGLKDWPQGQRLLQELLAAAGKSFA